MAYVTSFIFIIHCNSAVAFNRGHIHPANQFVQLLFLPGIIYIKIKGLKSLYILASL